MKVDDAMPQWHILWGLPMPETERSKQAKKCHGKGTVACHGGVAVLLRKPLAGATFPILDENGNNSNSMQHVVVEVGMATKLHIIN